MYSEPRICFCQPLHKVMLTYVFKKSFFHQNGYKVWQLTLLTSSMYILPTDMCRYQLSLSRSLPASDQINIFGNTRLLSSLTPCLETKAPRSHAPTYENPNFPKRLKPDLSQISDRINSWIRTARSTVKLHLSDDSSDLFSATFYGPPDCLIHTRISEVYLAQYRTLIHQFGDQSSTHVEKPFGVKCL
jgi:hypothetical protein